jgi:hypothetical protein
MTKHSMVKFSILTAGILAIPAVSFGGTQMSAGKESKPVVESVKESCITGDIGINVVSQYVSRGVIFENQGAIIQPTPTFTSKSMKAKASSTRSR